MYDTKDSGFTLFGRRIQANSAPPLPLNSQPFLFQECSKDDETESSDSQRAKKADKSIPCPRCNSVETKFCYFNNYNLNQPRHFCKSCQRYWTAGGMMRNVPVGAGRRKNKHLASQYPHITISPDVTTQSENVSSPMLGFYVPAAYWGCMALWPCGTRTVGSEDCLSPLSSMTNSCCSGEGLTTLGKRGRDVSLIDEEKSEKCRVGDSDEASKRQSCEQQRTE